MVAIGHATRSMVISAFILGAFTLSGAQTETSSPTQSASATSTALLLPSIATDEITTLTSTALFSVMPTMSSSANVYIPLSTGLNRLVHISNETKIYAFQRSAAIISEINTINTIIFRTDGFFSVYVGMEQPQRDHTWYSSYGLQGIDAIPMHANVRLAQCNLLQYCLFIQISGQGTLLVDLSITTFPSRLRRLTLGEQTVTLQNSPNYLFFLTDAGSAYQLTASIGDCRATDYLLIAARSRYVDLTYDPSMNEREAFSYVYLNVSQPCESAGGKIQLSLLLPGSRSKPMTILEARLISRMGGYNAAVVEILLTNVDQFQLLSPGIALLQSSSLYEPVGIAQTGQLPVWRGLQADAFLSFVFSPHAHAYSVDPLKGPSGMGQYMITLTSAGAHAKLLVSNSVEGCEPCRLKDASRGAGVATQPTMQCSVTISVEENQVNNALYIQIQAFAHSSAAGVLVGLQIVKVSDTPALSHTASSQWIPALVGCLAGVTVLAALGIAFARFRGWQLLKQQPQITAVEAPEPPAAQNSTVPDDAPESALQEDTEDAPTTFQAENANGDAPHEPDQITVLFAEAGNCIPATVVSDGEKAVSRDLEEVSWASEG